MVDKIIALIADELNLDSTTMNENSRLREDLNIDSLDVVELVMKLEEEFNIEVSDEDAANLLSIKDIANYVASKSE